MQTERNYEERRKEAAANLERRRQQMGKGGRRRKRRKLKIRSLKRLVIFGLILVLILALVVACSVHARKGAGRRAEDSSGGSTGSESAEQNENNKDPQDDKAGGKTQADEDSIIIGLKGSAVQLVLEGEPYIENGAFAVDKRSGAIQESAIRIRGKVDTSKPGDYTVKYTAKQDGQSAETERTVRVLTEEEYGQKAGNVPVMMYHWVYTAEDVPDDLDGNWILDTTLDEQMAYLSENEFYYPGWKELRAWIDDEISLPAKCAVLTFDDGREAFLKYGIPVLEKYKIPATSFMIGWSKNQGATKIKKYASPYIEFESHTFAMHDKAEVEGHKGIMATMTKDEIRADLAKAAELVGSNDAMAYPYGDYTDDMLEAVREQGILCSFTVEYDRVRKGMDPAKLPRVRVLGDESFQIWKESVY